MYLHVGPVLHVIRDLLAPQAENSYFSSTNTSMRSIPILLTVHVNLLLEFIRAVSRRASSAKLQRYTGAPQYRECAKGAVCWAWITDHFMIHSKGVSVQAHMHFENKCMWFSQISTRRATEAFKQQAHGCPFARKIHFMGSIHYPKA